MTLLCSFGVLLTKWPRPFYGLHRPSGLDQLCPSPCYGASDTPYCNNRLLCIHLSGPPGCTPGCTQGRGGLIPSIWRRRSTPEGSPRPGQDSWGTGGSGLADLGRRRAGFERHGRDVVGAMVFAQGQQALGIGGESVDVRLGFG